MLNRRTDEDSDSENNACRIDSRNAGVMNPWINSNIYGLVTDEVTAELRDDMYLNVNHDWLKDAQLAPEDRILIW